MIKAIGKIGCSIGMSAGVCIYTCGQTGVTLNHSGTIGITETASIVLNHLDEAGLEPGEIYLPDKSFKVYDEETVVRHLRLDRVSEIKYIPETMDCDDFAAALFGSFAGLVWNTKHALNWFITTDGQFRFIEPQTDEISDRLSGWDKMDIRLIVGR